MVSAPGTSPPVVATHHLSSSKGAQKCIFDRTLHKKFHMGESVPRISPVPLQISKGGSGPTDDNHITCLTITPDNNVVFGTDHGRIAVISLTGKSICELSAGGDPITSVSCDDTGKFVCGSTLNGALTVWSLKNPSSPSVFCEYKAEKQIASNAIDLSFSRQNFPSFAFADKSGSVFKRTKKLLIWYTDLVHSNQATVTKMYAKDGLVSWTTEKGIYVWKDRLIHEITPPLPSSIQFPRASFINIVPNILGVSFGCFYYEIHLDKKREIVVNMGENVMGMVVTGQRIAIKLVCNDKGKMQFLVDNGANQNVVQGKQITWDPNRFIDFVSGRGASHLIGFDNHVYAIDWEVSVDSLLMDDTNLPDVQFVNKCREVFQTLPDQPGLDVLLRIADTLLKQHQFRKAGFFCGKFLKQDVSQWDPVIALFESKGALRELTDFIPISVLQESCKKVDVLKSLFDDSEKFLHIFSQLPVQTAGENGFDELISELRSRRSSDVIFKLALMDYFKRTKQWTLAFDEGLDAKYLELFKDIEQQGEYEYVIQEHTFSALCHRYGRVFAEFLAKHATEEVLTPEYVMEAFTYERERIGEDTSEVDRTMCDYLHFLYQHNREVFMKTRQSSTYATILGCLYMNYHEYRPIAMEFLTKTELSYDYNAVLTMAMAREMYYEAVEISRRSGDTRNGMMILLERVRIPEKAVQYAIAYGNSASGAGVVKELIDAAVNGTEDIPLLVCVLENLASFSHDVVIDVMKRIPPECCSDSRVLEALEKGAFELRRHLKGVKTISSVVNRRAFQKAQSAAQQAAKIIPIP